MKKKGLIISTVVMVVVLLASITTATYAWFSSTATATVSNIDVNVGSSASVKIGVRSHGEQNATANYRYGNVDWGKLDGGNVSAWIGEGVGLGQSVVTGLSLDVQKAVGTGTYTDAVGTEGTEGYTPGYWTLDDQYTDTHTVVVASGKDKADAEKDVSATAVRSNIGETGAEKKVDIVDLSMGITASNDNLYGTFCKITITPNQSIIGMAAALRFEITVGDTTYKDDIFGADKNWSSTNDGSYEFYFMIDNLATGTLTKDSATPTEFSIKFFINGHDTDCCNDAKGTSAGVLIEFDGLSETNAATVASYNWISDDFKPVTRTAA